MLLTAPSLFMDAAIEVGLKGSLVRITAIPNFAIAFSLIETIASYSLSVSSPFGGSKSREAEFMQ